MFQTKQSRGEAGGRTDGHWSFEFPQMFRPARFRDSFSRRNETVKRLKLGIRTRQDHASIPSCYWDSCRPSLSPWEIREPGMGTLRVSLSGFEGTLFLLRRFGVNWAKKTRDHANIRSSYWVFRSLPSTKPAAAGTFDVSLNGFFATCLRCDILINGNRAEEGKDWSENRK